MIEDESLTMPILGDRIDVRPRMKSTVEFQGCLSEPYSGSDIILCHTSGKIYLTFHALAF